MKTYALIIFRSLGGQPRRATLTIVSICLAIALMSAASVLAASLQQTRINQASAVSGEFHGTFNYLSADQVEWLKQDDQVAAVGSAAPLGAYMEGDLNLTLEGFDATAFDLFNFRLLDGRLPEKPGEIALETRALAALGAKLLTGEVIHLSYQLYSADERGRMVYSRKQEGDFVLVGVLDDIAAARVSGVSLGIVSQSAVHEILGNSLTRYTAFVQAGCSPAEIRPVLERLQRGLDVDKVNVSLNETLVSALEAGGEATTPVMLLGALIVMAVGATIYNIFQISVVERIRTFGMLRSVGATPMQLILLVTGEALMLSLAAIPLGLVFGVGSAALLAKTLNLLKSNIAALSIPAWSLLAAAATGIVATLVSSLLPAFWASRISPISAIHSTDGRGNLLPATNGFFIRTTARLCPTCRKRTIPSESSPIRLLARMAYDNLRRNLTRSLVTIFSLGLGILLTILSVTYANGMDTDSVLQSFLAGSYAVKSTNPLPANGYPEEVAGIIAKLPGVDSVINTRLDDLNYTLLPVDQMEETRRVEFESAARRNPAPSGIAEPGMLPVPSQVFGYGVDVLGSLGDHVLEGIIEPTLLSSDLYALVVDPQGITGLHPGDVITLKRVVLDGQEPVIKEQTFEVAAILSSQPVFMGYGLIGPEVLITEQAFKAYTRSSLYKRFDITVQDGFDRQLLESQLEQIATLVEGGVLMSYYDMRQDLEREKRDLLLLVHGLVVMVSLIGVINIVNTLSMNLILRTREFGALRAIGMTIDQLKTITRLEGVFYGLASAGLGLACGIPLAYVLDGMMTAQGYSEASIQWLTILLPSLGGIAASMLATVIPARRISRLSINEALRCVD